MVRRRLLFLACALLAAVAIAALAPLHGLVRGAVELVAEIMERHPFWGIVAFIALAALSAMLAFFSSVLVVPIAVHEWGELVTFVLLWVGWLVGGATAYAIGRFLGRRVASLIVRPERIHFYEKRITARAPFPVVLLFQLALPSEIPGYVLGIVRYRFLTYFMALALAELPYALGGVFLGGGFLRRQYLLMIVLGVAGIGLTGWAIARLHERLGAKTAPE